MSEIKIIETSDGSQSLFLKEMNETYHSTHGALTESQYVFLEKGLTFWRSQSDKKSLRILEVGFGTGLNALLTLAYARAHPELQIDFHSLEPFPLTDDIFRKLNYADLVQNVETKELQQMHESPFDEGLQMDNFSLTKHKDQVQAYEGADFDLIYFDAFAPSKQKDVWQVSVFQSLYRQLNEGGVLVTYCAQGQFKRDLVASGFALETLQGPPGKKEMVRGQK